MLFYVIKMYTFALIRFCLSSHNSLKVFNVGVLAKSNYKMHTLVNVYVDLLVFTRIAGTS